ncbi:hypothetical protein DVH24_026265 [Malus domestica]|uniref:Uncharacterized protein n=1 Tax=Malus domestica TaxID=3750 RepID=A0A498KG24_MALDO|nr:hypothetical protein DVH24_026265 [Malus domestica]
MCRISKQKIEAMLDEEIEGDLPITLSIPQIKLQNNFTIKMICLLGVILKYIFPSLPSMRPFGSSLASGSVRTPKLSEKEARSLPGWVTHWEVACEFPKTEP